MRARELQVVNIPVKFAALVTAVATRAGTDVKEEQLLNILLMFVTAAVLNNGTVVKARQALNALAMFVTAAVLSNGTAATESAF